MIFLGNSQKRRDMELWHRDFLSSCRAPAYHCSQSPCLDELTLALTQASTSRANDRTDRCSLDLAAPSAAVAPGHK